MTRNPPKKPPKKCETEPPPDSKHHLGLRWYLLCRGRPGKLPKSTSRMNGSWISSLDYREKFCFDWPTVYLFGLGSVFAYDF